MLWYLAVKIRCQISCYWFQNFILKYLNVLFEWHTVIISTRLTWPDHVCLLLVEFVSITLLLKMLKSKNSNKMIRNISRQMLNESTTKTIGWTLCILYRRPIVFITKSLCTYNNKLVGVCVCVCVCVCVFVCVAWRSGYFPSWSPSQ